MEVIHKHEYQLRDLPTRTVTLFPSRAQVVRVIKNVALKPGINQVTVIGLTPTTDEHSIKVDGTGSAVITDISVQLLPNKDIFEDIYPDSDDDGERKDDEKEDEPIADPPAVAKLCDEKKQLDAKVVSLEDDVKRAAEVRANAEQRLKILDRFGSKFEPKTGEEMSDIIKTYNAQRDAIFQDHMQGHLRERELQQQVFDVRATVAKLAIEIRKEREKASSARRKAERARAKATSLEEKRRAKKQQEKARLRQEREKFWPRTCYTVCITLDATHYTPFSSRRSSMSSLTDLVKPALEGPRDTPSWEAEPGSEPVDPVCDLSISYVTSSACWSPCYDMQLNSTSATGTVMFDAELTNTTSESWKDCRIVLSTSQAVFTGLQDAVPKLTPWRIRVSGKVGVNDGDITNSIEERRASGMRLQNNVRHWNNPAIRARMFGIPPEDPPLAAKAAPSYNKHAIAPNPFGPPAHQHFLGAPSQQNNAHPPVDHSYVPGGGRAQQTGGSLFGSSQPQSTGAGLFGGLGPRAMASTSAFGAAASSSVFGSINRAEENNTSNAAATSHDVDEDRSQAGEATLHEPEPAPELSFQESAMEETGMTTTYDLPGAKSLLPGFTASKQRVAHISFTGVSFSHTVVAKLRPAAFLQARLRNASRTALLKGPVGLTLDGTFMGRSTLPRCSPGESFSLGLGVDPAVRVTYPKVDVRRGTSGVFTTENKTTYKRAVTVVNTRAAGSGGGGSGGSGSSNSSNNKAVRLTVIDQVPVSENEMLKVELVHPRGLYAGGAEVSAGVQADGVARDGKDGKDGKEGKDWGRAIASMKLGGQINWDVTLNAGKGVKLTLEYNVSLPTGYQAAQVPVVE